MSRCPGCDNKIHCCCCDECDPPCGVVENTKRSRLLERCERAEAAVARARGALTMISIVTSDPVAKADALAALAPIEESCGS